jgi:hypothetical protein
MRARSVIKSLPRVAAFRSRLQVSRKYLAAVTRPQATPPGLPMATAIADVHRLHATFQGHRASVLDSLVQILATHRIAGRQIRDANIVATMPDQGLEQGIRRLPTFNVADFKRFAPLIEIDPLP